MKVPFLDFRRTVKVEEDEICGILAEVAKSGCYLFGPRVATFESEFAAHLGFKKELVNACHSGTDAITLSLLAFNINASHEVITATNTAVATAAAIASTGATPVFCDVEMSSRLMDLEDCLSRVSDRTAAVIAVHLYGNIVDVPRLRQALVAMGRADIRIIEDAAQAHGGVMGGNLVGTMGDCAAFSFFPSKNLGAMGDGGAVVCKDEHIATQIRALRFYGQEERNYAKLSRGINSRMDEFQAAVLSYRLKKLDERQDRKRELRKIYEKALNGTLLATPPAAKDANPAWHLFVVAAENECMREELRSSLRSSGVETMVHYPIPLHLHPAFQNALNQDHSFPCAEALGRTIFSLPFSFAHTEGEIFYAAERLKYSVLDIQERKVRA